MADRTTPRLFDFSKVSEDSLSSSGSSSSSEDESIRAMTMRGKGFKTRVIQEYEDLSQFRFRKDEKSITAKFTSEWTPRMTGGLAKLVSGLDKFGGLSIGRFEHH